MEPNMRDAILEVDTLLHDRQRCDPKVVPDGAVNLERYLRVTPRILWILKEPNQTPS